MLAPLPRINLRHWIMFYAVLSEKYLRRNPKILLMNARLKQLTSMFNCPYAEETAQRKNLKVVNNYAITDNLLCIVCPQLQVPS